MRGAGPELIAPQKAWGPCAVRAAAVVVALTIAAACAGRVPAEAMELVCLGTEPFWRLDLTEREARYTPMEGPEARYAGTLAPVSGRLQSFTWRGGGDGSRGDLVAFVARTDACSDGMSDLVYPFEAFVSLPDGTGLQGCCRPEGAAVRE
jgi:uncharacterized membrane protein